MNSLKLHLILRGLRSQNKFLIDQINITRNFTREKKTQLREPLNIGENVLVTAERIKKKSAPGKF